MSDIVIKAENISKLYHLGKIGTGSLRRDMQYWWKKNILKIEDPFFLKKEELTDKSIWALKDLNFEIREGEAWGIIGRNGAGKSTFLKILSRIIKPTLGTIKGQGKVSSLLEVGTGFHPELTGRENIFLSGYMLGMKRYEILQKFDEIVEFSGIGRFLETPVKRYSSGMYVRLAFSVAAHLEPDILIVDEVLAVGDAEFQKKCIGKMNDASTKKGRTIIFVSHNLQAISTLCSKAIWLNKGSVHADGDVKSVINKYMGSLQKNSWEQNYDSINAAPGNDRIRVLSVSLSPQYLDDSNAFDIRTPFKIKFRFYNTGDNMLLSTNLMLYAMSGEVIFVIGSRPTLCHQGFIEGECNIPGNFLNDGSYGFSIHFKKDTSKTLFNYEECLTFDVADYNENTDHYDKWWGHIRPDFPLILKEV